MSTYRLSPDTQVDFTKGIVQRGEDVAHLTDIEERMLAYLLDNAGRDIGRGELLERVWGY